MFHHEASFVFIFFFLLVSGSSSSANSDFFALLSFKESLLHSSQLLSSWVNSSNPCLDSWFGVTCNPTTHRVTRLVLENLNLTGSIHPLAQLPQLRLLSLKNNLLSSSSNLNFSSWPNLKHLYLSYNQLSGKFPSGISRLHRLHRLDLSHNHFSGDIPINEIVLLPHLLTLRLEANSFAGTIDYANPLSSSIVEFNVSGNHLCGKIPAWLTRFPVSSFAGNDHLCGEPLRIKCSNQTVRSQPVKSSSVTKEKRASNWLVFMIVGVDAAAIMAVIATITCCCYYRRRRRTNGGNHGEVIQRKGGSHPQIGGYYYYGGGGGGLREGEEMVVFEGCKGFSGLDDLLKSSAELLGKGSVGTTYKVEMDGGDVVVVKRVRERRRKREVSGWLRMVGGVRHSNIVSLRAYYNSKDEILLVYDHLPNGSLQSLLHGNRGPGRTPLEWTTRLKLASDSAQGLAFLHGYNKAKLFHGNLTSSNILIDHLGNACISEICLGQLLHSPPPFSNNSYKAPELAASIGHGHGKFTQKCDVYSFGVILLEILTGKMPTGEGETSLVRWVQRVRREEWTWEVFDFELYRCKEMEEEMVALMQVALLCLAPLPKDRPKMSMVVRMIEDIRTKGSTPNSLLNAISSDSSPSLSENTINFTTSS